MYSPDPSIPAFPDRLRLPLDFDPSRLANDLAGLSDVPWTAHFVQQNYEGDWSVIALRAPKGAQHPIQMILSNPGVSEYVDTPFMAHAPYFQAVLAQSAANRGTSDRVHMVVDATVNGWVKDLLTRAMGTESGQAA